MTFEIKNTGDRAGDEVAQLYFHQETSSVTTYVLNLCGFERVSTAARRNEDGDDTIHPRELEIINREGQRVVEPGNFRSMSARRAKI